METIIINPPYQDDGKKYVDLKDFEDDYEICVNYPYEIRKKKTNKVISESLKSNGYVRVKLNRVDYTKHRLIAIQFIPNPNNLPCVDHINHIRTDNRISNLRWCSYKDNNINKSKDSGEDNNFFDYADFIDEDMMKVEEYGKHKFENYYYNTKLNRFFVDTGVNYKELHNKKDRDGYAFVNTYDKNKKHVQIYYNKFKRIHDLI